MQILPKMSYMLHLFSYITRHVCTFPIPGTWRRRRHLRGRGRQQPSTLAFLSGYGLSRCSLFQLAAIVLHSNAHRVIAHIIRPAAARIWLRIAYFSYFFHVR
jgi:hypothetical protein